MRLGADPVPPEKSTLHSFPTRSFPKASPDPHTLSPATRDTAILVARVIFYNRLLVGLGLAATAIGVLFFQFEKLATPAETWLLGAVFIGLAVTSFGFAAMANTRIAKLKKAS